MKFSKKCIAFLLAGAFLMLCGCNSNPTSTTAPSYETAAPTVDRSAPLSDGKTLKLLAITSSFGLNTTQLLYDVAVAEGCTDVVVGRLYYSGCTLQRHVDYVKNNTMEYQYTKISDGRYETKEGYSLKFGLQDEDWDIIYIQQSAAQAPIESSYGNYLDELMVYVNDWKTNPDARFVWNMTWAYQSDSTQPVFVNTFHSDQMAMYDSIVDVTKKLILLVIAGSVFMSVCDFVMPMIWEKYTMYRRFSKLIIGLIIILIILRPFIKKKLKNRNSYEVRCNGETFELN